MLSCSALKAVRSRRPPLPPGSSGPGHSGSPSGGGCSAPHGCSPAPGDRVEGERGQPGPGNAGVPARLPGLRAATARLVFSPALGAAQVPVRPPPPSAGAPACPGGRGDRGYLQRGGSPSAPCSCRLSRPSGPRTAPFPVR